MPFSVSGGAGPTSGLMPTMQNINCGVPRKQVTAEPPGRLRSGAGRLPPSPELDACRFDHAPRGYDAVLNSSNLMASPPSGPSHNQPHQLPLGSPAFQGHDVELENKVLMTPTSLESFHSCTRSNAAPKQIFSPPARKSPSVPLIQREEDAIRGKLEALSAHLRAEAVHRVRSQLAGSADHPELEVGVVANQKSPLRLM